MFSHIFSSFAGHTGTLSTVIYTINTLRHIVVIGVVVQAPATHSDATGLAVRSNASDLGQSSTLSRPARHTPRAQPRGKGPPTGPGARADGPAPHARTPAPLWGPFPGQRAQRQGVS